MPTISLPQFNRKISCEVNENLMVVLQKNEVPVASSCLGDGICGKCVLNVDFNDKQSPVTELEAALKEKHNWNKQQRASCQVKIISDIKVTSTYW